MFSLLPVLESDFAKKKRSDRPSNTALPKRDAPISLGSLQDALCSTMCNCARCKVQCAIVQGAMFKVQGYVQDALCGTMCKVLYDCARCNVQGAVCNAVQLLTSYIV